MANHKSPSVFKQLADFCDNASDDELYEKLAILEGFKDSATSRDMRSTALTCIRIVREEITTRAVLGQLKIPNNRQRQA